MKLALLFIALTLCLPAFANDSRAHRLSEDRHSLSQARSQYRTAVRAHGSGSPEAANARQRLRESRRTFHEHRRAMRYH